MQRSDAIDLSALERLRTLGGDILVSKMVDLFISHAEGAIADASAGLASGDLDAVRRAAHSLKSSAGNLGARHVQKLAETIEQSVENRSIADLTQLITSLKHAYSEAKAQLGIEIR